VYRFNCRSSRILKFNRPKIINVQCHHLCSHTFKEAMGLSQDRRHFPKMRRQWTCTDWGFFTLTEVFPCFFLSCKANVRVNLAKTGHGPHFPKLLCCSTYCLFCVVLCIVCVYMCTVLLPPGDNPIAVNKYIISEIQGRLRACLKIWHSGTCMMFYWLHL